MKITNKYNIPDTIVRAVKNDPYKYTGNISVTQLIKSPRQRWLEIRHSDEIEVDVVDRLWSLLGQAVHYILEKAVDKHSEQIAEERVSATLGGWTVSGQADLWTAPAKLEDYKVTSVWSYILGGKIEWEQQLNMLAYLYRSIGFPVEQAQIVAIFRDWSRKKAEVNREYPSTPVKIIPVKLWSNEEVEEYMLERIKVHKEAESVPDDELPFCTEHEKWQKPNTWAVMKNKNKRATRVFESKEEAENYIADIQPRDPKNKYHIVFRPGEPTRCLHYCPARPFCNQYLQEYCKVDDEDDF